MTIKNAHANKTKILGRCQIIDKSYESLSTRLDFLSSNYCVKVVP